MKLKRFASGFVAAVMALAVLGTPLGDILPFVRESVATVASADTYTYGDFEYSVLDDGTVEITGYSGSEETIDIPGKIDGKSVTSIGSNAFIESRTLSCVSIPGSVANIGECAFEYCSLLTTVIIANGVKNIGNDAFAGCTTLTSIALPESVTSIGSNAFGSCSSLTSITIPNKVERIEEFTFYNCDSITDISISNKITDIGLLAFGNCNSLTNIILPDSIINIADRAFENCTSLISLKIPQKVENIGSYTFSGCSSLVSVELSDSLLKISDNAFNSCISLKQIDIPLNVNEISSKAFNKCSSLENINVDSNNKNYLSEFGVLYDTFKESIICYPAGKKTKNFVIDNGVKKINDDAFSFCNNLNTVTLSNGITDIGKNAFMNCNSLTSIVIPDSVVCIGAHAFYNCKLLAIVKLSENLSNIAESTFESCSSITKITIPKSINSIKTRAFWACDSLQEITISNYKDICIDTESFSKSDELVIKGYSGSETEVFAKINGYKFESMGICPPSFFIRVIDSEENIVNNFNISDGVKNIEAVEGIVAFKYVQGNSLKISAECYKNKIVDIADLSSDKINTVVLESYDNSLFIPVYSTVEDPTWNGNSETNYFGGSGTESDPYLISNAEQLALMNNQVNQGVNTSCYFSLIDDILLNDMTDFQDWNVNPPQNNWVPIGNENCKFSGTFDGNGHTITGLYINSKSTGNGLFGVTKKATIKNLTVKNAYINCSEQEANGALVGWASDFYNKTTITNCSAKDVIVKGGDWTGALVGRTSGGGIIDYCYASGKVYGGNNTGGILGGDWDGFDLYIRYSYNEADVSGKEKVGGITGVVPNGASSWKSYITDCYNTGNINGNDIIGGIVGVLQPERFVMRCYNIGKITANADNCNKIGAIVGDRQPFSGASDVYYLDTSCKYTYGGTWFDNQSYGKLSINEMSRQSKYDNFDFINIWGIETDNDSKYPFPKLWYPEYIKNDDIKNWSIVAQVAKYCRYDKSILKILDANAPEEIKNQLIRELYGQCGITDIKEGIDYLLDLNNCASDFLFLTTDDNFCSYLYQMYLAENPDKCEWLTLSSLLLGGEINSYIDIDTYVTGDYPGVKKYEAMLLDYMEYHAQTSAIINTIKNIETNIGKVNKGITTTLIAELENCEGDSDKIDEILCKDAKLKAYFTENENKFTLSDSKGFGKFAKYEGYFGKALKFGKMTYNDVITILNADSTLSIYYDNKEFLEEIVNNKEGYPVEMRAAAQKILNELEQGYMSQYKAFFHDIVKEMTSASGLSTNALETLSKYYSVAGELNFYLESINITSFMINAFADVKGMLEKSSYLQGYFYLTESYQEKLFADRSEFMKEMSTENAWKFYYDYEQLRKLRIKAEETYLGMCDIKGFFSSEINSGSENIKRTALVNENIKHLSKIKFSQTIPEGKTLYADRRYVDKVVVSGKVDVKIKNSNNEVVATLKDGKKETIISEDGKFVSTYNIYSNEFSKVIYFNDGQNYSIEIISKEDGYVNIEAYTYGSPYIYKLNNLNSYKNDSVLLKKSKDATFSTELTRYYGIKQTIVMCKTPSDYSSYVPVSSVYSGYLSGFGMSIGEEKLLPVVVAPSSSTYQQITWTSSDSDIIEVNNGIAKAVSIGRAYIYVKTSNGNSKLLYTIQVSCDNTSVDNVWSFDEEGHWHQCNKCSGGHDYGSHQEQTDLIVEPTCTESGLTQGSHCEICGATIIAQEIIPKQEHIYSEWKITVPVTCMVQGEKIRICENCGNVDKQIMEALGHEYPDWWVVDEEATCGKDGLKSRHCIRCNEKTDVTVIPATEYHSYEEWTTIKMPTCIQNGEEQQVCKICGNVKSYEIPALGHDYSDQWTIDEEADCVNDGSKSRHCSRCDAKTDVTVIEAKGHTEVVDKAVAATCTADGYTEGKHCSVCNAVIKAQEKIAATGHKYVETVVKPSYSNRGYTLYECSVCGYSYKDNYEEQLIVPAVTGFASGSQTKSSAVLGWDKVSGADGYAVELYTGGKWNEVFRTSDSSVTSCTVGSLKAVSIYTLRIRAFKDTDDGTVCSDYTRLAVKTKLANVAGLKAQGVTATAVKLDWARNAGATGYIIEQYKGGKWTQIAVTKNNTTLTFTVKGLAECTPYSFRVKAYKNDGGKTNYSDYVTVKASTLLGTVKNAKVTSTTGTWITLGWDRNTGATGYVLEQYKGGRWTEIAVTKNNTTLFFTVKGLRNDTTYSFRIKAYKTVGDTTTYGSYVRVVGTTDIPNVAKFTGSAVSASAVKLDWSKNDKATGYVIEQYKGGKWTALATTKNNTTLTFTVKGLAEGTTYSFRIKSFRKTGSTTEFSEYASVKVNTAE